MTTSLSPRQLQIAELLQQGKKTTEIAEIVGIAHRSVRAYLFLAYKKTGTHNVKDLTQKISADGLDAFKHAQIPHNPVDRYKLMTRLRWRDGDTCCICGGAIDFRIKKKLDPNKPTFWYESYKTNESLTRNILPHGRPLRQPVLSYAPWRQR